MKLFLSPRQEGGTRYSMRPYSFAFPFLSLSSARRSSSSISSGVLSVVWGTVGGLDPTTVGEASFGLQSIPHCGQVMSALRDTRHKGHSVSPMADLRFRRSSSAGSTAGSGAAEGAETAPAASIVGASSDVPVDVCGEAVVANGLVAGFTTDGAEVRESPERTVVLSVPDPLRERVQRNRMRAITPRAATMMSSQMLKAEGTEEDEEDDGSVTATLTALLPAIAPRASVTQTRKV